MRTLAIVTSVMMLSAGCGGDSDPANTPDSSVPTADADPAAPDAPPGSPDAAVAIADAAPVADSPLEGRTIPDPGTGAANWAAGEYHGNSTPETAHPVGIVTEDEPYVVAYVSPDIKDVFFVFRTGPSFTQLTLDLYGNEAQVIHTHIHDGDGLVFGSYVAPVPGTETATTGTWGLLADHVYVLEIHTALGGFV